VLFPLSTPKSNAAQVLFAASDSFIHKSGWGPHVAEQLESALQAASLSQVTRPPTDVLRGDVTRQVRVVAQAEAAHFNLAAPLHLNGRPAAFPPGDIPRGVGPVFRICEIQDGYFASTGGMPLIYNSARELFSELSSAYWPVSYFYQWNADRSFAEAIVLHGETLVLADDIWEVNFCHWLVDTLPRLALLGPRRRAADFNVIVGPYAAPFQTDSLVALGIAPERIFTASGNATFRCDRMLVPTDLGRICHPAYKASSWATDFLRSGFPSPTSSPRPSRVYLSRGDASRRKIINDAELIHALGARGFRTIYLSELTFLEQSALLREATTVIGLHGAGLSHVVFMPSGGSVIEVFPSTYGTMSFWPLTVAGGSTYYTYDEKGVVARERPQCDDVMLDVSRFVSRLDTLL
jgi:hypothetical protein